MKRTVSLLAATMLLAATAGYAATTTKESAGQYLDDAAITTKVKAAMFDTSNLKAMHIDVKTNQGVVQLSGFVGSKAQAARATEVARGVDGVKGVKNDIQIKGESKKGE